MNPLPRVSSGMEGLGEVFNLGIGAIARGIRRHHQAEHANKTADGR